MTLTMKKGVAKAILALCLLKSTWALANVVDVRIPPDTEVAYFATNSTVSLSGPTNSTLNQSNMGIIAIIDDRSSCIPKSAFHEEDGQYYFYLLRKSDNGLVGYVAFNYSATAKWVRYDGTTEEGSVRVHEGEIVQIENLEASDNGNPYCITPPNPDLNDDFYDPDEDRQVDITITGGVIKIGWLQYLEPGEYYISLYNNEPIDTLYASSLSPNSSGNIHQSLINAFNITVQNACTLNVEGNTSPKFYLASDEGTGAIGSEQVTISVECDGQVGNVVVGSVRLQTGTILNEPNKFYLVNDDLEDNGLYIEGIINGNGYDCDDEGDVLFNGETFDIDLDYYDEFTIDWNLCKDEYYIEPGIYHGALDLSVFVK